MKSSTAYALVASLIPFAVFASPVNVQRDANADVVVVTNVQTAVETAEVVVTADGDAETPAPQVAVATSAPAPAQTPQGQHQHHNWHSQAQAPPSSAPVVVVPTSAAPPPPPPPPPPSSAPAPSPTPQAQPQAPAPDTTSSNPMIQAVLNSTNTWRAKFGQGKVVWNDTLANMAVDTANSCSWDHTNAGQNYEGGDMTYSSSIDNWGDEWTKFPYWAPNSDADDVKDARHTAGHFSQLVWPDTTSVGCAEHTCPSSGPKNQATGWFFVCNYFPVGNWGGEYDKVPKIQN